MFIGLPVVGGPVLAADAPPGRGGGAASRRAADGRSSRRPPMSTCCREAPRPPGRSRPRGRRRGGSRDAGRRLPDRPGRRATSSKTAHACVRPWRRPPSRPPTWSCSPSWPRAATSSRTCRRHGRSPSPWTARACVSGRTCRAVSSSCSSPGFCERGPDGHLFNSCVLIDHGQVRATYRKAHLWDRESEFFSRGHEGPPVVDTSLGRVAMMICYDVEFPEWTRMAGPRRCGCPCRADELAAGGATRAGAADGGRPAAGRGLGQPDVRRGRRPLRGGARRRVGRRQRHPRPGRLPPRRPRRRRP